MTGDNDSPVPGDDHTKSSDQQQFVGPFAHYSTISSAVPSSRSSPQPTFSQLPPPPTNSVVSNAYGPPSIPNSIQTKPHLHVSSSQSSPTVINGYSGYSHDGDSPRLSNESETPVAGRWHGTNDTTIQTPITATSGQDYVVQASSDGFISLMDNQSFAFESKPPSRQASSSAIDTLDDEEDLGLGNSKSRPHAEEEPTADSAQENKNLTEKPVENPPGKH